MPGERRVPGARGPAIPPTLTHRATRRRGPKAPVPPDAAAYRRLSTRPRRAGRRRCRRYRRLDLRVVGDLGDLAEQVDELLGDPDEVAGVMSSAASTSSRASPWPSGSGVGEAGVELAGQGQPAGLLVGVDLLLELAQGAEGGLDVLGRREGRVPGGPSAPRVS